jgi:carbamoyltransferase
MSGSSRILGIGGLDHNGSVTLLEQGQAVAIVETERLVRQKNVGLDNPQLLDATLDALGTLAVDHVALADVTFVQQRPWLRGYLRARFPTATQSVHQHHSCHMAAAFFGSGFEEATVVSVDGKGDGLSAAAGFASRHCGLRVEVRVPSAHSLGRLWWAASLCCRLGDHFAAGKTMAWAAYGEPSLLPSLQRHLVLMEEGGFRLEPGQEPERLFRQVDLLAQWLQAQTLEPSPKAGAAHAEVAASVQALTEVVIKHLVTRVVARTGCRRLCLAGGVALNGLVNQRLLREGVVDELYVPPVPDDRGLSLGAAALAAIASGQLKHCPSGVLSAYVGPALSAEALALPSGFSEVLCTDLIDTVAAMLAAGKLIAWCSGRAEIGPRALGNRSIFALPVRGEVRDQLNQRVKQREPFRPFGCSLPLEHAAEWLEMVGDSPYMLRIVPVRADRRAAIPAVVHHDGTTRPHTVTAAQHPELHRLLHRLAMLGHPPVLLNTSLNRRGEPIANCGADALAIVKATGLDAAVIGPRLFVRQTEILPSSSG